MKIFADYVREVSHAPDALDCDRVLPLLALELGERYIVDKVQGHKVWLRGQTSTFHVDHFDFSNELGYKLEPEQIDVAYEALVDTLGMLRNCGEITVGKIEPSTDREGEHVVTLGMCCDIRLKPTASKESVRVYVDADTIKERGGLVNAAMSMLADEIVKGNVELTRCYETAEWDATRDKKAVAAP